MSLPKRKFREMVLQILYSLEKNESLEEGDMIPFFMKQLKTSKKNVQLAIEFANKVTEHRPEMDPKIEKASHSYRFERIGQVEKNVIRLALYEIKYDDEIPVEIAISEAIRLSRKFANPESSDFVNAILDYIHKKDLEPNEDQG